MFSNLYYKNAISFSKEIIFTASERTGHLIVSPLLIALQMLPLSGTKQLSLKVLLHYVHSLTKFSIREIYSQLHSGS